MSDVSDARIDYPHIPRALLELVDFYSGPVVSQPTYKEGKREQVIGLLLLSGAELTNSGTIVCPFTRGIMAGSQHVWLKHVNHFFKEQMK